MDDDIVFRGEGPCDVFLRRVRKVAFDKGKHKDGDWMAGYASTCFEGEALKWYEELDEDVQDDWKQLRKALLERFPPISEHSPQPTFEPSPSSNYMNCIPTAPAAPRANSPESRLAMLPYSTAPTLPPASTTAAYQRLTPSNSAATRTKRPAPPAPAAAPPFVSSQPGTFGARPVVPARGRLAVVSDSPRSRGYVRRVRIRGYYEVTTDPGQALQVEYSPGESGQPVDFRLLDSQDFDRLGMVWHVAAPKVAALSAHNALCVAVQGPPSGRAISCDNGPNGHCGPVATTVWSLGQDGSVNPVWETDNQNYYGLQTVVFCEDTKRILFVADWDAYCRTGTRSFYDKVRLVLESV